jgi:hypothetical protein
VSIAEAALGGSVFSSVGNATHYHANYVVPYWASSLDKTAVIGAHIFYRWRGSLGEAASFRQRYAGSEPSIDAAITAANTGVPDKHHYSAPANIDTGAPLPTSLSATGKKVEDGVSKLEADERAGTLLLEVGDPPEKSVGSRQRSSRCRGTSPSMASSQVRAAPIKPLGTDRPTPC